MNIGKTDESLVIQYARGAGGFPALLVRIIKNDETMSIKFNLDDAKELLSVLQVEVDKFEKASNK